MEYDITKHEWWNGSVDDVDINESLDLHLSLDLNFLAIRKQDAIALARHFKLTTNDLGDE